MGYASLADCVLDLERHGHLLRISAEMDPDLQMAAIQRRVYAAGGPALLFERVRGSRFPAVSNIFGTMERARFIFRDSLARVQTAIGARADLAATARRPGRLWTAGLAGIDALPKRVARGPVQWGECKLSDLPAIRSWPDDGGPFVLLPQVLSEDPDRPGPMSTNLGMYRIQLSGNDYRRDEEIGLHYQIHRGIGVHHARALERGQSLRVAVFVGGPPAHTVAAVMPMPEGMSELVFAGMLARRRFRWTRHEGHFVSADADFCILGHIVPDLQKPEGPFGDHLGYYSLRHDFPVMRVERVFHRKHAIWPFTVVGRPPQEDTTFGALIHELTEPMAPKSVPGLVAFHAVDAAGVHPLMFAIGRERYVPYARTEPQELLTISHALLGFSHASLAKYLFIAGHDDRPELDIHDEAAFLQHVLERVDFRRDLHFHTRTTIDTLDYSGHGFNRGSKLVMAALGPARRKLCSQCPGLGNLPDRFDSVALALPGVLVISGARLDSDTTMTEIVDYLDAREPPEGIALIVVADDAEFSAKNLANFLWVSFTRSDPARDVYGRRATTQHKHWGCEGPLVIDARIKAHHAPPLEEDPRVSAAVEALAARGGPLEGVF